VSCMSRDLARNGLLATPSCLGLLLLSIVVVNASATGRRFGELKLVTGRLWLSMLPRGGSNGPESTDPRYYGRPNPPERRNPPLPPETPYQHHQQQTPQRESMPIDTRTNDYNSYGAQAAYQPHYHAPPPLPPDLDDDEDDVDDMHSNEQALGANTLQLQSVPPFPLGAAPQHNRMDGSAVGWDGSVESIEVATDPGDSAAQAAQNQMDLSAFNKQYILKGLARLYRKKILPLELASRYGHFHSPPLSPSDFDAPPLILLLGQYSVGKTSFVKYLLGRDFPGIRVGPEPTTDRFTAILWGSQDKIMPGAALCSQQDRPFTGLNPFGNNFLSRMEGAELDAPVLRNITIIDTPGILSGQKQRSRNYDYEAVMKWFAERADLIIVMFDAHKLDISDELKGVMELMIPHLDKIRVVLNKADSISTQQLMRVYGALMWSLGKVMNTPEVCRVYMGSFWDTPYQNTEQADLLQREEMDLLHDIMGLPQQAVMRRINELVKRARSVKVHAYIIHYLRKQLPYMYGKREKQKRLIGRLEGEFLAAARRYGLPRGDFPPLEPMRQALYEIKDLSDFPKLDKKLVREMDKVFSVDIPELLEKARHQ
jgi:GTPase SAR1 family protein